jgi:hypothetical protein
MRAIIEVVGHQKAEDKENIQIVVRGRRLPKRKLRDFVRRNEKGVDRTRISTSPPSKVHYSFSSRKMLIMFRFTEGYIHSNHPRETTVHSSARKHRDWC